MTFDECVANVARLLLWAELETDQGKMEKIDGLAVTWLNMADLIVRREQGAQG